MPRLASTGAFHQKYAMRSASLFAGLVLLAGCGSSDESGGEGAEPRGERIECSVGGAPFDDNCTVERVAGLGGLSLVIRAPNGSFRRFRVTTDGRGLIAADGAEPATVTVLSDKRIEVSVAGDRYRLPATVKP